MRYQDTSKVAASLSHDDSEVPANQWAMEEEDYQDAVKAKKRDEEDDNYIYSSPPSSSQESRPSESDDKDEDVDSSRYSCKMIKKNRVSQRSITSKTMRAKSSVEESEADGNGDSYDIDEDLWQYSQENSVFRRSVTPRARRAESTVKVPDVGDDDSDSKDSNTEDECDPYEPASSSPTTRVAYKLPHDDYIPYLEVLSPLSKARIVKRQGVRR